MAATIQIEKKIHTRPRLVRASSIVSSEIGLSLWDVEVLTNGVASVTVGVERVCEVGSCG